MQTRNDRCAPCYGRRAVLGPVLGLALAPLLVGVARAEDESEKTDAARLPPPVRLSAPLKLLAR